MLERSSADRPRLPGTPAAERRNGRSAASRRYRARLKSCEAMVLVRYGEAVVDFLVRTRWLDEARAHDRRAVGEALGKTVFSVPFIWAKVQAIHLGLRGSAGERHGPCERRPG
jgi:hypothetical protein